MTEPSLKHPSLNIVIACGGTGGHLFPGIAYITKGSSQTGNKSIPSSLVQCALYTKYPNRT